MKDIIKDRKKLEDILFQNERTMKELGKRYDMVILANDELKQAKLKKDINYLQIKVLRTNVQRKQRSFIDCISRIDKEKTLIPYVKWYQFEHFINEMHSLMLELNVVNAVYKTH